ncbi:unnamed protein product [Leptosia nina]|uniref:Chromo domain-containing protein n=1 Tax=Leptosia nina TaxID=320188 RepID=A0AAV1K3G0_9NEOP
MRKVSKNRVDDDVVSSTNGSGSLPHDDNPELDRSTEDGNIVSKNSDEKNSGHKSDTSIKENDTSKTKTISRRRKSVKRVQGNESDKDDTDEGDILKETSKSPKTKGRKKSNKKKTAKESKKDIDEEEYEVDRIVDSKRIRGKLHYLIRWKGYSADSDTWEPHDTLSCPDVITKFKEEKENPTKKGTKRKASKKESKVPAKKTKTHWNSENADENAEYEVERILEVHHKKNGEREFLIHWKGWSNKFDSWEPEKNLHCPDLIKRFMDKVSVARSTQERSLRVAPETTNRFTLQAPSSGRRLSKRRGQRQRVRYDNAE